MRLKIGFCLLLMLCSFANLFSDDFSKIEKAIFEKHKGSSSKNFVASVSKHLKALKNDGSWGDINYGDKNRTNWPASIHYSRLQKMAQAYANRASSLYRKKQLHAGFIKALTYFFNRRPKSTNWWNEGLNEPQHILLSLIIFNKAAPKSLALSAIEKKYLDYYDKKHNPDKHGYGANRMDVALWHLYQAVLRKNSKQLKSAIKFSFDSLNFTTKEGFQHDGSNHSHGTQNYIYGYGELAIARINNMAAYLKGTNYKIPDTCWNVYRKFLLGGYAKSRRGGYICFNVTGRGIARIGGLKKSDTVYQLAKITDASHAAEYDKICKQSSSPAYRAKPSHTHFYRSDFTTHHRPNYCFTVQTNSTRVEKQEKGNSENLKGAFLSEGATNILIDGDEYFDIMGHWDWNRIPGTTVPSGASTVPKKHWGYPGTSTFTGGVSDGRFGLHCFYMNEFATKAIKSWFCFDNEIVCLGSGISSTSKSALNTTINQAHFAGQLTVSSQRTQSVLKKGENKTYKGTLNWIWHDRVLYLFHDQSTVRLSTKTEQGNWIDINKSLGSVKSKGEVFKLWIDHGKHPKEEKYHYSIVPGLKSPKSASKYNPKDVVVLSHDNSIHAVYHKKLDILQAIFYKAKTLNKLGFVITPTSPIAVIIKNASKSSAQGYISDPAYKLESVSLKFSNKYIKNKELKIKLPTDKAHQGSSVKFTFRGIINQD